MSYLSEPLHHNGKHIAQSLFSLWIDRESNPDRRFRRPVFYPIKLSIQNKGGIYNLYLSAKCVTIANRMEL